MHTLLETPSLNSIPMRRGEFQTLAEALDYAASGTTGLNFYCGKGELAYVLPYSLLRREARELARKLAGLGLPRGARMALVAETGPDFVRFFFACQYAGLVPVPLPAMVNLGGRQAMVDKLRGLVVASDAQAVMGPSAFLPFLTEAAKEFPLKHLGDPAHFESLPTTDAPLMPLTSEEFAYLQYTSGSTRFPRGVIITQRAVMANLKGITTHGLDIKPGDRCVSWLPYYHDMGMVGALLAPVASQLSCDYLSTHDFAMRPRLWPALISRNRGTISFGPSFGYELCLRRMREKDVEGYDLSSWRVAGTGAEPVRADVLAAFAEVFAPAGFRKQAYVAAYGMAECALAISFAPLNKGIEVDRIDAQVLADDSLAVPLAQSNSVKTSKDLVFCGAVLPGHEIEVRDETGARLGERCCGILFVRGPSVMSGYLNDPVATSETLSADGWLNTGDRGYLVDGQVVITGRQKDMIIINGRNIWPQDLEFLAEEIPGIRPRDAAAFSVPFEQGKEAVVLVVQCRQTSEADRALLVEDLRRRVREEFGVDCMVELVPPHTLPQTSSGKLSRATARADFMQRNQYLVAPALQAVG